MERWVIPAGATDAAAIEREQVPIPLPGPGQVRVRVRAVSINARDQLVLKGWFGRLPDRNLVPMSDVAGEVDALGADVTRWAVGDRVTNLHFADWDDGPAPADLGLGLGALDEDGVLAEYVVLAADRLARAPRTLDFAEAATLPVAGVTAWNAVAARNPAVPGGRVMIIGSGGVALFALQLAQAAGAAVFAAVRQDAKGERLRSLGAAGFVNTASTPDWGAAVHALSGGVDKAVDTVGAGSVNQSIAALRGGGEVALVGLFEPDGVPLDAFSLMAKTASVRGVAVGSGRMHRDLVEAIDRHGIRPVIDLRLPFAEAPSAFRAQASADIFGKVVIEVPGLGDAR
jgi:NADPH:quinone reductase-like Zn-dependent oxidoreductase